MSFTAEQINDLEAPLFRGNVKERKQAGRQVSYVESWWAESEANRIFGYDGWDTITLSSQMVSEREVTIGKGGNYEKPGWSVSYVCTVRVQVWNGDRYVTRDGVGAGHGIDADLGQAHESAIKEAASDAEKRALKTFGNQFGLALYDKTQSNVANAPPPEEVHSTTMTEGKDWWNCNGDKALSAHAAKQKGLDKDHEEFRMEISAATTTDEWRAICKKYSDRIAAMPLSWRIEARADADFRGDELGISSEASRRG